MRLIFLFIICQLGALSLLASHTPYNDWSNLRWRYLTVEDGLLNYRVSTICQDKFGFIWIGSSSGLNRYDGYRFESFIHNFSDSTSLSNNDVNCMMEDSEGTIWVGTHGGGLNLLKENRKEFIHLKAKKGDNTTLSNNVVRAIYEDRHQNIWVGTSNGVLHLLNKKNKTFIQYKLHDQANIQAITENKEGKLIVVFYQKGTVLFDQQTRRFQSTELTKHTQNKELGEVLCDSDGDIWLGGQHGLYKYQPNKKEFTTYPVLPEKEGALNHKIVYGIHEKAPGYIWALTDGGGINILDKNTDIFSYISTGDNGRGFNSKAITAFFEDRDRGLWVGTVNGGLNYSNKCQNSIDHYTYDYGNTTGLSAKSVLSLCESKDGNIWIGLDQGGVNYFDRTAERFTHYMNEPQKKNSLIENVITNVYEDSNNDLYIGTYLSGFDVFNKKKNQFKHYWGSNDNDPSSPTYIKFFYEDSFGDFWIGTTNRGLAHYNRKTKAYTLYEPDEEDSTSISEHHVLYIYEDRAKNLWVGSGFGLNLFNREQKTFKKWINENDANIGILGNRVSCIYEDEAGYIWVATDKALNKLDVQKNTFERYMIGKFTRSILPENDDFLWVSTDQGIYHFSKKTGRAELLNLGQDIIGQQFEGSGIKTKDGKLWFGSLNGVYSFHPKDIKKNKTIPPIIINKLLIANQEVHPSLSDSPLKQHISETQSLTLTHTQSSVFTLEFVALNYIHSQQNQYAYRLEGFEKEWNYVGNQRNATYTNIDPGTYTFRVKGSNNDGVWNEKGTAIEIIILPPWWKTWWAMLLYFLIMAIATFSVGYAIKNRIKLLHKLKLAQIEKEKAKEMNKMKSQFFTNISHEFKTPLTLILGPLNKLITSGNGNQQMKRQFLLMRQNANRLLNLIDQLMDFRKAEIGHLKLRASESDLIPFVQTIVKSFYDSALEKHIHLQFNTNINNLSLWFDHEKLEKVLFNLLSNAFKYTPINGCINVDVHLSKTGFYAEIKVKDTGCGIPTKQQQKVFERFYQISPDNPGSGIGLSLCKILVELHKGKLLLNSEKGEGSQFIIKLPLGKQHLSTEEQVKNNTIKTSSNLPFIIPQHNWSQSPNRSTKTASILIVEDEIDIRNFLKDVLIPHYKVIEAVNGLEGMEKAKSENPDLVISDIMMPEMNGFLFCKRLKTNLNTSHIPIILLTARGGEESLMEGLETGADDYLTKPFNPQILLIRIKNLIHSRQKLKDRFLSEFTTSSKELTITSIDEQFMIDAVEIVEKNLSEQDFNVDRLVKEMGMSRSVFSKKIKALSGQSPSEFIKTIKLKRATQLLLHSGKSISEIAYELGFITPKTFRTNFKKQFGQTPSDFLSMHKEKKVVD